MKLHTLQITAVAALLFAGFTSCSSDDNEAGPVTEMELDFSGTYMQKDQMGRPGINTVLAGSASIKNDFNVTVPSEQTAKFQPLFLEQAVALHTAFGAEYETNILGLDAPTLTTILATDVLQVAPDVPTTYFDGTNILTGRNLKDDVIDVSLILIFGGESGARFNGQDTDGDGMQDLPLLVSDGVDASGETPSASFPYLEEPHDI